MFILDESTLLLASSVITDLGTGTHHVRTDVTFLANLSQNSRDSNEAKHNGEWRYTMYYHTQQTEWKQRNQKNSRTSNTDVRVQASGTAHRSDKT